jgi:RHS repeat-associated protein
VGGAAAAIYSFYHQAGQLMFGYDAATGQGTNYIYLNGKLIARHKGSTVTYLLADRLGSPVREADASGNVTASFSYLPYGGLSSGPNQSQPGFTGHVNDPETAFVYMQARYYDAGTGHMLSVDPVGSVPGDVFGFNRYSYANNNPVRYTDPDGRKCGTVDGKDSCTFDAFKDRNGKSISREMAMSSGNWLSRLVHADRGSRILRAEAGMTAKYSAAKNLAAKGGSVTIKGNSGLGIPDQSASGLAIVSHMETINVIATAQGGGDTIAFTPAKKDGGPSDGPIVFYKDGAAGPDTARTFGHEILHTIYSGVGVPNHGWANPRQPYRLDHQDPFDSASDEIR